MSTSLPLFKHDEIKDIRSNEVKTTVYTPTYLSTLKQRVPQAHTHTDIYIYTHIAKKKSTQTRKTPLFTFIPFPPLPLPFPTTAEKKKKKKKGGAPCSFVQSFEFPPATDGTGQNEPRSHL